MKSLIEFITNLFARTRGMGNKIPPTQQNDIIKMLEDSLLTKSQQEQQK